MKTLVCCLFIALFSFNAEAQSTLATEVSYRPRLAIEESKNYFGVTQLTFNGIGFSFGRRLTDRWILGVSFLAGSTYLGDTMNRTGSLKDGTYYANSGNANATLAEINASYYFKEDGYKNSGPLIRLGGGRAQGGLSGQYNRFDKDPAAIIIGDGRRKKETGPTSLLRWDSYFSRLGAYYQIMWTPQKDRTIGGHIIEIGGSVLYLLDPPVLSIERPNGENSSVTIQRHMPIAEVSYKFVF